MLDLGAATRSAVGGRLTLVGGAVTEIPDGLTVEDGTPVRDPHPRRNAERASAFVALDVASTIALREADVARRHVADIKPDSTPARSVIRTVVVGLAFVIRTSRARYARNA